MDASLLRGSRCVTILSVVFVRFPSSPVLKGCSSLCVAIEQHDAAQTAAVNDVTEYFDVAVHQVRAGSAQLPLPNFQRAPLAQSPLGNDDLTILTGWAQALAEALVHDPECVEVLLADARGKTQWRTKLGLPEPSSQLSHAIYFLSEAVHAMASQNGNFSLDGLQVSLLDDRPAEDPLDRLARRVLRERSNRSALNRQ